MRTLLLPALLWGAPLPVGAAVPPSPDVAMDQVAHALATHVCVSGTTVMPPVDALMRQHGHWDAQAAPCAALSPQANLAATQVAECVARQSAALDATRVGRAQVRLGRQWCHAAVVVRHLAQVAPVPLAASAFSEVTLQARGLAQGSSLEWLMMDPKGRVTTLQDTPDGAGGHTAVARFHGGDGTYTLQLMVDAGRGPEVAMQQDVRVGAPAAPSGGAARARSLATNHDVLAALRLLRSQWGLPSVLSSPALQDAAAQRLSVLQAEGTLQHLDARRQGVTQVYAALPDAPALSRLAEVLASGPTLDDALDGLLRSPAHRRHLQDGAFTHAGVASAPGVHGGQLLVVTLGRAREDSSAAQARQGVLARLNEERRRVALPPLELELTLQPLLDAHAARLARLHQLLDTLEDGRTVTDAALRVSHAQRARVQLYRVSAVAEITAVPALLQPRSTRVGIGTAGGAGVDGMYVVVVVLEP